jgi:hypothetical protein
VKFYSAIKKNEIWSFSGKWMQLENIMLSDVSQVQNTTCLLSYMELDLKQIQEYYEKQVTLRGDHMRTREGKRRNLRGKYG